MITELAVERRLEPGDLGADAAGGPTGARRWGRVRPAIGAAIIARPEHGEIVRGDGRQLEPACSSSFSTGHFLGDDGQRDQIDPIAGQIAADAEPAAGGTTLGSRICRSASWHNHTASSFSVMRRPGRCVTS